MRSTASTSIATSGESSAGSIALTADGLPNRLASRPLHDFDAEDETTRHYDNPLAAGAAGHGCQREKRRKKCQAEPWRGQQRIPGVGHAQRDRQTPQNEESVRC